MTVSLNKLAANNHRLQVIDDNIRSDAEEQPFQSDHEITSVPMALARAESAGVTMLNATPYGYWGAWLAHRMTALWTYLRREREIARSVAMLSRMDDRTLRDIGMERGQIESAVRHGRDFVERLR
jgi:uncharacterized protein YjiS (DUF1127 family)